MDRINTRVLRRQKCVQESKSVGSCLMPCHAMPCRCSSREIPRAAVVRAAERPQVARGACVRKVRASKMSATYVRVCVQRSSRRGNLPSARLGQARTGWGAGAKRHVPASHEFGPVVVRHEAGASPFLAVGIGAGASKEAVVCVLEDRDPR